MTQTRWIVGILAVILISSALIVVNFATAVADEPLQPPPPDKESSPIDWANLRMADHEQAHPPSEDSSAIAPESSDSGNSQNPDASLPLSETVNIPPPPAESDPLPLVLASQNTYIVQRGDTLYGIARRFNVTLYDLLRVNNIGNPTLIHAGLILALPYGANPNPAPATATPVPAPPSGEGTLYTVQRGDSFYRIAQRFNITTDALINANLHVPNPRLIHAGLILRIPGATSPVTAPQATPQPQPNEPTPTPAPTAVPPTESAATYTVQAGDSLHTIARRFGVTVRALASTNGITNYRLIHPGLVLIIPDANDPYTEIILNDLFIWPVESRSIVQYYRYGHRAIDVVLPTQSPVVAIAPGVVEFAGWNNHGYGYMVVVDHGDGWRSLYAHHDSLIVSTGQEVAQGEVIALSGNTGRSSMPHLHLEIMHNLSAVDPCRHLPGGC